MKRYLVFILVCITCWSSQLLVHAQATYVHAKHMTYDIVYDYSHMAPAAVFWTLQASDFSGSVTTKPKYFKQDRYLPKPRLKNELFTFSGYQRGHLCPSGDRDSRKDWFKDTYYTSNIVPMKPETNAGAWKETEQLCRKLAADGHQLRIVAGPVWYHSPAESNTQLLPLVPDTLYKVATCTAHHDVMLCWLIPNSATPHKAVDCQHDLVHVMTVTPPEIAKLIRLWMQR